MGCFAIFGNHSQNQNVKKYISSALVHAIYQASSDKISSFQRAELCYILATVKPQTVYYPKSTEIRFKGPPPPKTFFHALHTD